MVNRLPAQFAIAPDFDGELDDEGADAEDKEHFSYDDTLILTETKVVTITRTITATVTTTLMSSVKPKHTQKPRQRD
jgi:hypothetical protein